MNTDGGRSPMKAEENIWLVTKRNMKSRMLGVYLREHTDNQTLCRMSGVMDTVVVTTGSKICWAR